MADFTPTIILDQPVVIDPNAVQNEQQKVVVTAEGGTFTLTFGGKTTGNIKFNATALEVSTALAALSTISSGDVRVSGGPGDATGSKPYLINFVNSMEDQDVAEITATATNLTGTTHTAVVSTVQPGAGPTNVISRALPPQGDATERVQPRNSGVSPKSDRVTNSY